MKFKVDDDDMYEEFHYPNTHELTSPYSGPYKILKQLSEVSFEIDRPNLVYLMFVSNFKAFCTSQH